MFYVIKKYPYRVAFLIIFSLVTTFLFLDLNDKNEQKKLPNYSEATSKKLESSEERRASDQSTASEIDVDDENKGVKKTPSEQDKVEIAKWMDDKGYEKRLYPIDIEYDSYSYETLKSLAALNTDTRAMLAFARKEFFRRANGYPAARYMYELAAVYGSTKAINQLANVTTQAKILRVSNQSLEEKREAWKEVLSMNELAKLRGDRFSYTALLVRDKVQFDSLIQESDWGDIQSRAQKLYEELEAKRIDLGLGKFDNSESVAVKKLYDAMEASFKLKYKK